MSLGILTLLAGFDAESSPLRSELDSGWKFRQARLTNWYPATVPGVVHTDLIDNGIIEDPFYRLNERGLQWIDKEDWIYETEFDLSPEMFSRGNIELKFDGLDTYADITLNGEKILSTDNMFRRWKCDIKGIAKERGNILTVYFHSPIKVALPMYDAMPYRYEAWNDQAANGGLIDKKLSPYTRKAGYHYGWDWGPRLVTSGIWRPAYIEAWDDARIENVQYIQKQVNTKKADIKTVVEVIADKPVTGISLSIHDADGSKELASGKYDLVEGINRIEIDFTVPNPQLWWCNGLGEPHLYTFTVSLGNGATILDYATERIGLRSIEVVKERDEWGRSLYFVLNGEPVFCKGANYIPCDNFLPRVTPEIYRKTVQDAKDVNMNMLRVWGGGIYEDDRFYDYCDEMGIMVWQDFMYACSVYPAEGELLENMRLEAIENVRRNKSINSFYGLVSLGWDETYYLDLTARNDWSSTLPPGNNSYFYPSVSASILLDKVFNLKETAPWMDMLKIRGSWANVGNDTNPYNTQEVYLNGIFSSSYYLPTTERNPHLKPENVESWETGLEMVMFKGRWSVDAAFYTAATTNQIISSPIDGITGARYKVINAGKVTNKGVELATTFQPVKTRDFRWEINLNWAFNKNRLVELADGVEVWQVNSETVGSRVYIYAYPGTELGRIYGWGWERAPKGSFYIDDDGNKVDCSGEVVVNQTTGNPVLNTEDLKDFGSIYPDWKAGMTQSFRYKNLTLGFTFTGQKGGRAYSVTNFALSYTGKLKNSLPGRYEGLVHEGVNVNSDGTYTKNRTITTDIVDYYNTFVWNRDNAESNTFSTSYLKLREANISYSLPSRICEKTGFLQGVTLGVYATNLFCWTNFPQYDPDAASMNGSSISRGIEQGAYPMTRTYGFNLKLSF